MAALSLISLAQPAVVAAAPAQPPTVENKGADTKVDAGRQRANADAAVTAARQLAAYQDEFIALAAPAAQQVQTQYNLPASVTIGQAILESNWGRSTLSVNDKNYFGFKCVDANTPGPIASGCHAYTTQECTPTECHDTTAYFRVYSSMTDSLRDYARLLTTVAAYAPALPYRNDPNRFIQEVAKKYATDPDYATKVINVMTTYNLYGYNSVSVSTVVAWTQFLQVYGRGMPSAHAYQRPYSPSQGWLDWVDLGGVIGGTPKAVEFQNNLYVFAVGSPDRHLYVKVYNPSLGWGFWTDLGATVDGTPVAVPAGDKLHLFLRDSSNLHLVHRVLDGTTGTWADWEDLGQTLGAAPSAILTPANEVHVYAVQSPSGHLLQRVFKTDTGWGDWADLAGTLDGTPGLGLLGYKLHVVARDSATQSATERVLDLVTSTWDPWQSLGGTVGTSPTVVTYQDTVHIFVAGVPTQKMYQKSFNPTMGWTDWVDHGGSIAGSPAVTQYFAQLQVFAIGTPSYGLYQRAFTPGSGWTGWAPHGGTIG
ncbi:glucosaminidase domain-containing protein [Actinocrispum sp. NPDC049592]|uniref:glucosaminidase domain-containing protein n=1 Tax=Actinocrispum sp. NPDC049592 TaxID=3154835 RepID=UPI003445E06D